MLKKIVLFLAFIVLSCSKDAVETTPVAVTKFQVTVSTQDDSKGTVSTTGGSFEAGSDITITATPKDGFQFTGWTGGASGDTNPLTVKVSEDANITATFAVIKYTLKVNVIGNGKVIQKTTKSSRATGTTTDEYSTGDVVQLSAAADDGWLFYTWSGASTDTIDQIDVTIDESKTITATFEEKIINIVDPNIGDVLNNGFQAVGKWRIRRPREESFENRPSSNNALQCEVSEVVFRIDGTFTLTFNTQTIINGIYNAQKSTGEAYNVFLTVGNTNFGVLEDLTVSSSYIKFIFKSPQCATPKPVEGDKDKSYVESEDPNTNTPTNNAECRVATSLVDGPQTQTVTQTNAIKIVSYSFSTTCTDSLSASVSGLPPGVTMNFNSNKAIISGTPSAASSGTYNYAITTRSSSASTTIAGVIIVNERCYLSGILASGPQSQVVSQTSAISTVTYTFNSCGNVLSGSATGLPPGVTMNFSNNQAVLSGVPTNNAVGNFNYVITVNDTSTSTSVRGSISVNPLCLVSGSLTSGPQSQNVTQTSAISAVTYTFSSACKKTLSASASGLPSGVTLAFSNNQAIISGTTLTDTATGTYNYTISVQDSSNVSITVTGIIIVTDLPNCFINGTLSNGPSSQTVTQTNAINAVTYSFNNCNDPLIANANGLPPGVTMSFNALFNQAVISGTPTTAATDGVYNYSIIVNDSSQTFTVSGVINVIACKVSGMLSTGAQTQTATQSTAISPITYTFSSSCGKTLNATATGLPTGVTMNFDSTQNQAIISGTPTVAANMGTYNYGITVSDGSTSTTISGAINVIGCKVSGMLSTTSAGAQTQTATQSSAISPITYTFSSSCGKTLTHTLSGNLPTGVTSSFANNQFVISGTPTVAAAMGTYNYGVTVSDGSTSTTISGTINLIGCKVSGMLSTTSAGAQTQTATQSSAISPITYTFSSNCGKTLTHTLSGNLPAGVTSNFANNQFVISGTPTVASAMGIYNYDITVSDGSTSTTISGTINLISCKVSGMLSPSSAGAQTQTATQSTAISTVTYIFSSNCGKPLNATATGLPTGVTMNFDSTQNQAVISGTPTVAAAMGTYNYGITVSDGSTSTTISGTINVVACKVSGMLSTTSTGAQTQTATQSTAISTVTYAFSSNCRKPLIAIAIGLPTGIAMNFDSTQNQAVISGTPTAAASGTYNYGITVSDGSTSTIISGAIIVNPPCKISGMLSAGSAGAQTQTVTQSNAIKAISYNFSSTNCGKPLNATVTGLPPGLTMYFNPMFNEAHISGAPTAAATMGTYIYGITVSYGSTSTTVSGTINVIACKVSGMLSAGAQTQTATQSSAISPITYTFSSSCGRSLNATATGLPTGVTMSFDTTQNQAVISGTPTTAAAMGTYNYGITVNDGRGVSTTISGTINVIACKVSGMLSAGAQTQTVKQGGVTISPITYTFSSNCGKPLNALVTGLPTWANMSFDTTQNQAVISGKPTIDAALGTYNYGITVSDGSTSTTISGTIIVNPLCKMLGTVDNGPQTQTVKQNTAISIVRYRFTSDCGNRSLTATDSGLPPGVTMSFLDASSAFKEDITARIDGTPTATGTYDYIITVNVPIAPTLTITSTVTGTIVVN